MSGPTTRFAARVRLNDQPIGYHPCLARVAGGVAEAVLLRQLLHWDRVMADSRGARWDGWFYKSAREICAETGMSRTEFETARRNLLARQLIETKKEGIPCTTHYRLDLDRIEEWLRQPDLANQFTRSRQAGRSNLRSPDCADSAEQPAEPPQSIHESTQESEPLEEKKMPAPPTPTNAAALAAPAGNEADFEEACALACEALNKASLNPEADTQKLRSLFERIPDLRHYRKARDACVWQSTTHRPTLREFMLLVENLAHRHAAGQSP